MSSFIYFSITYQYNFDRSTRAYESPSPIKAPQEPQQKHSGWNLCSPATITGPVIICAQCWQDSPYFAQKSSLQNNSPSFSKYQLDNAASQAEHLKHQKQNIYGKNISQTKETYKYKTDSLDFDICLENILFPFIKLIL